MLRLRYMYWGKVVSMEPNRIAKKVYEQTRQSFERARKAGKKVCTGNWSSYTYQLMRELGLEEHWDANTVASREEWNGLVRQRVQAFEQRQWEEGVSAKPKLRTYRRIESRRRWRERRIWTGVTGGGGG